MKQSLYKREIERLYRFLIPQNARVLELGCGDGSLLAALRPAIGLGVELNPDLVAAASRAYADRRELTFQVGDVEACDWSGEAPFDYVVASDLIVQLRDVQTTLTRLQAVSTPRTRLILNFHSNLWRPIMSAATSLGLRPRIKDHNWLATEDVRNLLYLAGFEVVVMGGRILVPKRIPLVARFFNRFLAPMPVLRNLCLAWYIVARPIPHAGAPPAPTRPTVSVLVPTRSEKGNIEGVFTRTPLMGSWTELVFVDGHSTDGTVEEILRCSEKYSHRWPRVTLLHQTGKGKGQAVRQGFAKSAGDILMILDSDLTMPPEDLSKYYEAIVSGKGEFANGCRLVYQQEDQAMRFLNMIANHFFAKAFSWLLSQPIKDTLCGTKAFWRRDYERIAANRSYFGDFDPFGDFDLLFGAAKLSLKIVDIPVRYRARTYGDIKISRWRDGMLLFRMCAIAFRRFKLS